MKIVRKSPLTGLIVTREIAVTESQIRAWEKGELIQDVMPELSADDREFIISGCTPEDFNKLFPEE